VEPAPAPATPAATPEPDAAATLAANQWQLTSAADGAGQALPAFFPADAKPLGLLVADGRLIVTGSCNRLSAGLQWLDATQMQLTPGPSTMMACPPPLAEADAAIAKFLSGTVQVALSGEADAPQLQLTAADGSVLAFSGTPTPETRFGGPGTRAFLEVSTEPCEAPASSTCLKVRDRQYDENGIAIGTPGEWRALADGIEGFTPVAGEQAVVRVKRFETPGADGSAATEHFVFDMTVETRVVE
jgi:heat shock protein HslJ